MNIDEWYQKNTFHYLRFDVRQLVKIKNKKNLKISLCLPTLNESQTIEYILRTTKKELYQEGLLDEVIVIDSGSTDSTLDIVKSIGFKIIRHKDILKKYGTNQGKGEALWKSLHVLNGDIIAWCDSDIKNFHSKIIYGILGPLIMYDEILLVKAFYRRPLEIDGSYMKSEGGRVTEILVRPILNLFYPELSRILQPLAGEYAARREILEQIPFFTGYGVETGMLIDVYEKFGLDKIGQVDVIRRIHKNQPLSALSKMAFGILQAVLEKLQHYNKIIIVKELNKIFSQIDYFKKEYFISQIKLEEKQRPPMAEIEEYMKRKYNSRYA